MNLYHEAREETEIANQIQQVLEERAWNEIHSLSEEWRDFLMSWSGSDRSEAVIRTDYVHFRSTIASPKEIAEIRAELMAQGNSHE
jgi:hypothetical protein